MNAPTIYHLRADIFPRACLQGVAVLVVAALLSLGVNLYRPKGLPLVTDWSPEARLKVLAGDSMSISLKAAMEFYDLQEAVFVDVRPGKRFTSGHIPGAIHISGSEPIKYSRLFSDQVPDPQTIILIYDDNQTFTLARNVMGMLKEGLGYTNVRILENGLTQWMLAGYPVVGGGA